MTEETVYYTIKNSFKLPNHIDKIISLDEKNSKYYTKRSLTKEQDEPVDGMFHFITPTQEILEDVKGTKILGALNKSPSQERVEETKLFGLGPEIKRDGSMRRL
jgi:hypothetical protein